MFIIVKISDIHISIFHDSSRITEFQEFCSTTIDAIQPKVVLASGDLTDAKHKNNMGSGQYKEEWTLYRNTLNKFNVQNKTVWLDTRGNHGSYLWKKNIVFETRIIRHHNFQITLMYLIGILVKIISKNIRFEASTTNVLTCT